MDRDSRVSLDDRGLIRDVTKVNVYFIALLLAVLVLVTYVPAVPMGPVEFFYR